MPRSDPATYAQLQLAARLARAVAALTAQGTYSDNPTSAEVLDALAVAGLALAEDDGSNAARHAWDVLQQRERERSSRC